MPEIPDLTHTTTVYYKSKGGVVKELQVKIPMDPTQIIFTMADLQLLAREIGKVLQMDAQ